MKALVEVERKFDEEGKPTCRKCRMLDGRYCSFWCRLGVKLGKRITPGHDCPVHYGNVMERLLLDFVQFKSGYMPINDTVAVAHYLSVHTDNTCPKKENVKT